MSKKKTSCPVCGQRRCTESPACVEFKTRGTIDGLPTTIITYDRRGHSTE